MQFDTSDTVCCCQCTCRFKRTKGFWYLMETTLDLPWNPNWQEPDHLAILQSVLELNLGLPKTKPVSSLQGRDVAKKMLSRLTNKLSWLFYLLKNL